MGLYQPRASRAPGARRTGSDREGIADYANLCGWALAMAHAKSGDPAVIAGYLGKSDGMDAAVARFAFAYAKQTERDHDALAKAAKAKRIEVARAG